MTSDNVGMSSDNVGENPTRRKPEVSYAMMISVGLAGPKTKPKGAADGQLVKIPAPDLPRLSLRGDAEGYAWRA